MKHAKTIFIAIICFALNSIVVKASITAEKFKKEAISQNDMVTSLVTNPPLEAANRRSITVIIAHCEYDQMNFKNDYNPNLNTLVPNAIEKIPITGSITILQQLSGPPLPSSLHLNFTLTQYIHDEVYMQSHSPQSNPAAYNRIYDYYGDIDPANTQAEPRVIGLLDDYWIHHMLAEKITQKEVDVAFASCYSEEALLSKLSSIKDQPYLAYCLAYEGFKKGLIVNPQAVESLLKLFSTDSEMTRQLEALTFGYGNSACMRLIFSKLDLELNSNPTDERLLDILLTLNVYYAHYIPTGQDDDKLFHDVYNKMSVLTRHRYAEAWNKALPKTAPVPFPSPGLQTAPVDLFYLIVPGVVVTFGTLFFFIFKRKIKAASR